jgi:hypothetical protein
VLTDALERARRLHPVDRKLPHVTGDEGRWQLLSPVEPEREALTGLPWTGGFVAGQLRLAGEHAAAAEVDRLLAPRAASRRHMTSASSSGLRRASCGSRLSQRSPAGRSPRG